MIRIAMEVFVRVILLTLMARLTVAEIPDGDCQNSGSFKTCSLANHSVRVSYADIQGQTKVADLSDSGNVTYDLPPDLPGMKSLQLYEPKKMSLNLLGLRSLTASLCNSQLVHLNVAKARSLTTVDPTLLKNCSALLLLKIQGSKVENITIADGVNSKLENLILIENKIQNLPPLLMHMCPNLKNIDLTQNELANFPVNFFFTCNSLTTLTLRNNKFSTFELNFLKNCDKLQDIDLSRNFLVELFLGTELHIRFLNLEFNQVQKLPAGVFSNLPYLEELNMNFNNVTSIDGVIFESCDRLRFILMKGNSLRTFPVSVVENCSRLFTLDLSDNQLTLITNHFLPSNLRYLSLGNNKLEDLPGNLLAKCHKLNSLFLSGNRIATLPSKIFSNSPYLKKVQLSANKLTSLPPSSQGTCLQILDASGNNLTFINLTLNPAQFYNLSYNRIEVIIAGFVNRKCLPTVIDASHNNIKQLKEGWTIGLQNLLTLNLSYNQMTHLSKNDLFLLNNLKYLNLSHNKLNFIAEDTFDHLFQIIVLDLNHNQLQLSDANSLPVGIINSENLCSVFNPSSVNDVIPFLIWMTQLSGNDLCLRPNNCICAKLSHLMSTNECLTKDFHISVKCDSAGCPNGCQCSLVNNEMIVDCKNANLSSLPVNLRENSSVVYLDDNKINLNNAFQHSSWSDVIYLHMRKSLTNSAILTGFPFSMLKKTRFLDLSQNSISTLPQGTFKGLGQLTHLDLSNNDLSGFSGGVLSDMISLETLDMSGNKLQSLSNAHNPLAQLSRLKRLILNNNQLKLHGYFQLPNSLQYLTLTHNLISSLDFIFDPRIKLPTNLTTVDMRYNDLTNVTISLKLIEKHHLNLYLQSNKIRNIQITHNNTIKGMLNIFLKNNYLNCDCYLNKYIRASNNSSVYIVDDDPKCHEPIFYKGKSVKFLTPQELMCPEYPDCPKGCQCYKENHSNNTQIGCSAAEPELPLTAPSEIHTLYISKSANLTALEDPSWINLRELFLLSNDTTVPNSYFPSLTNFVHLDRVEIDENCWCRVRDYIAFTTVPTKTTCTKFLPPTHCVEIDNKWLQVECTSPYIPDSSFSNSPSICPVFEDCQECSCYLDSSHHLIMNCNKRQMTRMPQQMPNNVNTLHMDDNLLESLPELGQWSNLKELYVRNNSIQTVNGLTLPPALKVIYLDHNKLMLPSGWLNTIMAEDSTIEVKVSLVGNPLQCDCGESDFSQWSTDKVLEYILTPNSTFCDREGKKQSLQSLLCSEDKIGLIIAVSFVLGILVIMALLLALYFKYRRNIHVYFLTHEICMCLLKEESFDDGREYQYDAFLSYSSEDSIIIVKDLLPGLEKANFKVCVHERDWLGGQFISEQIVESVQKSRRTIIVLSENYLKSPWATMEFRVALQQALEDRVNRIIVVVPNEVPRKELMEPDFRSFVTMNTYLFLNDNRFWDKIIYAMPHKKKGQTPFRRMPQEFIEMMMRRGKTKRPSELELVQTQVSVESNDST